MVVNKPIFIIGSPRSGTSILTWCLGQHPNMFPLPESNWMGDFARHVAIGYDVGTSRGDRSVLSAMDIGRDEFFAHFGQSINQLILAHHRDLDGKRKIAPSAEPKMRWVDGTPEYSLHVYALLKLFPAALFIHIVRDVRDVVKSMLNFHRLAGFQLVRSEEDAYKYWLRTVKACVQAEQACGPRVVRRIRYAALIANPETAIRSLLEFADEPYVSKCLEPLSKRINSSNVPADFRSDDTATDPAVVEEATRLSRNIEETAQSSKVSRVAFDEMETAFAKRVQHAATLDDQYQRALQIIRDLKQPSASKKGILSRWRPWASRSITQ